MTDQNLSARGRHLGQGSADVRVFRVDVLDVERIVRRVAPADKPHVLDLKWRRIPANDCPHVVDVITDAIPTEISTDAPINNRRKDFCEVGIRKRVAHGIKYAQNEVARDSQHEFVVMNIHSERPRLQSARS